MSILAIAGLVLEFLKLFWGAGKADQETIAKRLRAEMAAIRDAIQKSQDTEGDTSDLENIINKRG